LEYVLLLLLTGGASRLPLDVNDLVIEPPLPLLVAVPLLTTAVLTLLRTGLDRDTGVALAARVASEFDADVAILRSSDEAVVTPDVVPFEAVVRLSVTIESVISWATGADPLSMADFSGRGLGFGGFFRYCV
jgi:hypothetical protein